MWSLKKGKNLNGNGLTTFLMHRVEFKEHINKEVVQKVLQFLMHRVEFKVNSNPSTSATSTNWFLMHRVEFKVMLRKSLKAPFIMGS